MYSGEYDACDVTLSVYPHRASLKNTPQACPVWIYTQSNITSIISATVENITICCGLSGLKRSENQILALRLVSEKNRREKVRSVPTFLRANKFSWWKMG
jgi:hypothetical protein